MTKQQFCNEIDNILEIPPGSIKGNESLTDFQQWDSLAVLSFISMVDTNLSILVSASELAKCSTVADLMKLVSLEDLEVNSLSPA